MENTFVYKTRMKNIQNEINSSSAKKFPENLYRKIESIISGNFFENSLPNLYNEKDAAFAKNSQLIEHFYIYILYFIKKNEEFSTIEEFINFFVDNYDFETVSKSEDIVLKQKIIYMFLLDPKSNSVAKRFKISSVLKGIVRHDVEDIKVFISILENIHQMCNESFNKLDIDLISDFYLTLIDNVGLKSSNELFINILRAFNPSSYTQAELLNDILRDFKLLSKKYEFTNNKQSNNEMMSLNINSYSKRVIEVEYIDEPADDFKSIKEYCTSIYSYVGTNGTKTKKIPCSITLTPLLIQILIYFKEYNPTFNIADFIDSIDLNDKNLERTLIFSYNLLKSSTGDDRKWVYNCIVKNITKEDYGTIMDYARNRYSSSYVSDISDFVTEKSFSLKMINL